MSEPLRNLLDLRILLRKFGFTVYTGDRLGDLELMEEELSDLHGSGLLDRETYMKARMLIQREKRRESGTNI
ncbi:uncharacterized protein YqgQ [Melghirimyces profundicolus]|uniref:Uncharacterized protein YqgQ n=1 Tax=Melghirimyces profundicolus TaxID=1242148 RepID=A0A2T6BC79_9BACL|nr:YqgQ family protein [Melghirimyces profundicolus]PTX53678.1 uncharacterized protein YqgQ [Melghirimyces profundicolus]